MSDYPATILSYLRVASGKITAFFLCLFFSAGVCSEPLKLNLTGLSGELRKNTELHLETLPPIEPEQLPALRPSIRTAIVDSLQALGYYQPVIEFSFDPKLPGILFISVSPGEPVIVRTFKLSLQGAALKDKAFQNLLEELPLKPGDKLDHGQYESIKSSLTSLALARGYFEARLAQHSITVHVDERQADIELLFESGPRYRFGEIRYGEMSEQTRHLIHYLMTFEPGEPYSALKLGQLNRNLSATSYFRQIDVHPKRSETVDLRVPVYVDVIPDSQNHLEVGAGFSTDEGPRLAFSWNKPWVNEKGHSLSNEIQASGKRVEASSVYKIPVGHPMREFYNLKLDYQYKDLEDTKSNLLAPSIHRWRKNPEGWDRDLFFRLHYEDYRQGLQQSQNLLLIPGITLSRRRARGVLDPDWGDLQMIQLEFSSKAWGSDTDFIKVWGRTKWLRTLASNHRFIARLEQGAIWIDDMTQIPPSIRFFTGGDQTVRGFQFESISPRDSAGKLTGARYMTAGSIEYNYQFAESWRVATFIDSGTATNEYMSDLEEEWKTSVGIGLRWLTPLGPLKLDLAYGISEEEPPWRLHFTIGPDI